jgi:hypothetical protein
MKKFIVGLALLLVSQAGYSQLQWYGKVGGGAASMLKNHENRAKEFFEWKPTYSIGVGSTFEMTKLITFKGEISYINKGFMFPSYPESYGFHFHDLGLLASVNVKVIDKLEAELGARYSYAVVILDAYGDNFDSGYQRGDLSALIGGRFYLNDKLALNPRFQYELTSALNESNVFYTEDGENEIEGPKFTWRHIQALLYLEYYF